MSLNDNFKRLNSNESPYNIPSQILDKVLSEMPEFLFNTYPDQYSDDFRASLSNITKKNNDQIICTNGSDELIKVIIDTFAKPGDMILSHAPTFVEYRVMSEIRGCNYFEIAPNKDMSCDMESLLAKVKSCDSGILFLCSPNNPTGEVFLNDQIELFLKGFKGLVVVDEAYSEFADSSAMSLIDKYPNLLIMRTLSKAYGLASIRVGYGVANKNIIDKLNAKKMPYNLNKLSALIATIAMDNVHLFDEAINTIKKERNRMFEELSTISGLNFFRGESNFILVKTSVAELIVNKLLSKDIKTRLFQENLLSDGYFRFSISSPKVNDIVINTIKEIIYEN
ncbi:MAG: histidinol-phosphate transaminase [Acidaminobacteraceae bacterium]